jgi:hypothetical protein
MTDKHPITPPPELVVQWIKEFSQPNDPRWQEYEQDIATRAAQWGADTELEACCEWLRKELYALAADGICAARRPKPPSLKEQALLQLDVLNADLAMHGLGTDLSQIRRALEALPDD